MRVLEVPAHRILVLSSEELKEYDLVDSNGNYVSHWAASTFTLAVKGKKVYRKARYRPNDEANYATSMHYLEEV